MQELSLRLLELKINMRMYKDTFLMRTFKNRKRHDKVIAKSQNHDAADDGNVDFISLKQSYIQSFKNKHEFVDLFVKKLLNELNSGLISADGHAPL